MWHVSHGDKNFGPFSEEKMRTLIKAGKLPPSVYVWKQGTADWVMLRDSSLMQPAASIAAPVMAEVVAPAVAANPFDFSQPAARTQPPAAAAIHIAVSSPPTAQQLANPFFSDFKGSSPGAQPAGATANGNFRFLPLEGRKIFTVITTAITGVMSIVCGWMTFQQVELLKRVLANPFGNNMNKTIIELQASDDRFVIAFLIQTLALLAMTIAFLMWFYRAHLNAKAMSQLKFADTSGWAVGFFFVPIMNLFKPFVGMRDIWRGSFTTPGSYAAPPPTLVGIWWAASIIANLLNRVVVMRFESSVTTPMGKLMLFNVSAFGYLLQVVPLVLSVLLVTKISKQQIRKAQQMSQPSAQPQQKSPQPQFQMPEF